MCEPNWTVNDEHESEQDMTYPITEVQRYTYKPGDRFIVRVAGEVFSREQAEEIAGHFRSVMKLPEDVPVVVIDECVDVEVVSPQ